MANKLQYIQARGALPKVVLTGVVVLLLLAIIGVSSASKVPGGLGTTDTTKMKGICWVGGDSIGVHNILQATQIGVNWISQTPFGWMNGHDSPIVVGNTERAWWGEADRGIRHTSRLAQAAGVKTMLKPHIWLRRSGDKWRSDIAMSSDEEWDEWFASYQEWILHYARLAQELDIAALCIGTELHHTTKYHPDRCRLIIVEIRKVYKGQLTYAANWYREYEDIKFWDQLDYIGIQAYFPLSTKNNPSKQDLVKAWKKHSKSIHRISTKYRKKVILTEIGYTNTAAAATEPWVWPQDLSEGVEISDATQSRCYEALFESLWHEEWISGIFIWKWFHSTHGHQDFEAYFAERHERRKQWAIKQGRKLRPQVYFTPQHTEAIDVLTDWYMR